MSRMLRERSRPGMAIVFATALSLLGSSCGDRLPTSARVDTVAAASEALSARVLVSAPFSQIGTFSSSAAKIPLAEPNPASLVADNLAYVSLPPGAAIGDSARISNSSTRQSLNVPLTDGGFDPVAIAAAVGDELTVEIRNRAMIVAVAKTTVPRRRPPMVVRTDPPKGKTDVPLNTRITVVFSQPVDSTSLPGSLQLLQSTTVVEGVVTSSPLGFTAELVPATQLAASTQYELVISSRVHNTSGDALEADVHVPFTTGTSPVGPNPAVLLEVTGLPCSLVVTAKDASGGIATSYAGTVHFTATDQAVVLPPDYTFKSADRGTHTFPVLLKTPGSQSIRATDRLHSLGGDETVTFDPTVLQQPLYVTNATSHTVTVYTAGGLCNATPSATIAGINTGFDDPASPTGIAVDGTGLIYVAIQRLRDPGSINLFVSGRTGNVTPVATITDTASVGMLNPGSLAIDATGSLYVASGDIRVYAAGATGNAMPLLSGGMLPGMGGIALDAEGRMYVAYTWGEPVDENVVLVLPAITTGMTSTPLATIMGDNTRLKMPFGVAVDRAGRLYVANIRSSSITIYAPGSTGNVAPEATIGGSNTGLSFPHGIALDDAGRLYVANGGSSTITVYAAGAKGNATPIAMIAGPNTGLNQPFLLAFPTPTTGAPHLSMSPPKLDFGTQIVGTTSAPQIVTMSNNGSAPALLDLSLYQYSEFAQTSNCPSRLAPGASCAVSITFRPTGGGTRTGMLFARPYADSVGLTGDAIASLSIALVPDPTGQSGRFLYAANAEANNVSIFAINSDGTLSAKGSIVAGTAPSALATDPSGKFIYVANYRSKNVSIFTIGADGALTPNGLVATGSGPVALAVAPDPSSGVGRFLYVANSLSDNVSTYGIDQATGALTPANPATTDAGIAPWSVAVHPSGRFAYVASRERLAGGNQETNSTLYMYSVDAAAGTLTPTGPGGAISLASFSPISIVVHPSGKFAYLADAGNWDLWTLDIDATSGTLSQIAKAFPRNPTAVAVHPSGRFAYVTAGGTLDPYENKSLDVNSVWIYGIAGDGSAIPSNSAFTPKISAGLSPTSIAIDPSGKFAYVANSGSKTISMYSIDSSSGMLNLIGTIGP